MNRGKVSNLESMVLVHCTILLEHFIKMRALCFDTDFVLQMKLTTGTIPLIHCFLYQVINFNMNRDTYYSKFMFLRENDQIL